MLFPLKVRLQCMPPTGSLTGTLWRSMPYLWMVSPLVLAVEAIHRDVDAVPHKAQYRIGSAFDHHLDSFMLRLCKGRQDVIHLPAALKLGPNADP